MPHDKHGRLIQVGDVIKTKPYNHPELAAVVGPVKTIRADEQTCTGEVAWLCASSPASPVQKSDYFGAGESELVLKADGSEPAPPNAQ